MKKRVLVLLALVAIWLSLYGCKSPTSPPTAVSSPLDLAPEATFAASPLSSPLSVPSSSQAESFVDGDKFELEKPLSAGAIVVRGKGEPSLQVIIVDVTDLGETLGTGIVDEQGRFEVTLNSPIKAGHRIGISINTSSIEFKCTQCQDIPLVGLIMDSARAEP